MLAKLLTHSVHLPLLSNGIIMVLQDIRVNCFYTYSVLTDFLSEHTVTLTLECMVLWAYHVYIGLYDHSRDIEQFHFPQISLMLCLYRHTILPPLNPGNHWSVHHYSFIFLRIELYSERERERAREVEPVVSKFQRERFCYRIMHEFVMTFGLLLAYCSNTDLLYSASRIPLSSFPGHTQTL